MVKPPAIANATYLSLFTSGFDPDANMYRLSTKYTSNRNITSAENLMALNTQAQDTLLKLSSRNSNSTTRLSMFSTTYNRMNASRLCQMLREESLLKFSIEIG